MEGGEKEDDKGDDNDDDNDDDEEEEQEENDDEGDDDDDNSRGNADNYDDLSLAFQQCLKVFDRPVDRRSVSQSVTLH